MNLLLPRVALVSALVLVGCSDSPDSPTSNGEGCDPSYPGVCIPPPPPDLNCDDIAHTNFQVVGADPHRFDGDNDGFGCEA